MGSIEDIMPRVRAYFDEVRAQGERYPYTATLATVGEDGTPWLRAVTVRGFAPDGLVFFGDRRGAKGRHLAVQARSALHFLSTTAGRQLSISGCTTVEADAQVLDAYWQSRSPEYRIAVTASAQSEAAESRAAVAAAFARTRQRAATEDLERPAHYAAFVMRPTTVEFWQSDPDRMHHRDRYRLEGERWRGNVLWP